MAPAFGRPAGWTVGRILAGPFDTAISRDAVIADPAGAVFSVSTAPTGAP